MSVVDALVLVYYECMDDKHRRSADDTTTPKTMDEFNVVSKVLSEVGN